MTEAINLGPRALGILHMLSEDLRRLVFGMFGRHFVSLLVCYIPKTGTDAGKEKCRNYSGFILSIRGRWHLEPVIDFEILPA